MHCLCFSFVSICSMFSGPRSTFEENTRFQSKFPAVLYWSAWSVGQTCLFSHSSLWEDATCIHSRGRCDIPRPKKRKHKHKQNETESKQECVCAVKTAPVWSENMTKQSPRSSKNILICSIFIKQAVASLVQRCPSLKYSHVWLQ